jgi:hypothetical protein
MSDQLQMLDRAIRHEEAMLIFVVISGMSCLLDHVTWVGSNYSLITRGWPFAQPGTHAVPDEVRQFGITSVPGGTAAQV